jgi:bis(5'-nucleosidyl)-tetraphosphatase
MTESRTAAGVILATVEGGRLYLLLRSASHGNWLPPKGHTDGGEDAAATALRELREETGITDVRLVPGFEREIEYDVDTPRDSYRKHVTYLLGITDQTGVTLSGEHDDAGWFALDEALARIPFKAMRQVLKDCDARLAAG